MKRFRIADFGLRIAIAASVTLGLALVLGCDTAPTTTARQSQQAQMRRADRGDALLAAAASQLADLPAAVDTQLRPPKVILDASTSANGEDVLATCSTHPNLPEGPINYVSVTTQNARFRSVGVRSGDILKYYVLEDETVDEERRRAGFGRQLPMDLTVAQVLDENTLLIQGSLGVVVPFPAKIEIWQYLDDRLVEINQELVIYATRRIPPLGWEPSPDEHVLGQVSAWLNQWLRQSEPKSDWQRDSMLQILDTELLKDEQLGPNLTDEALATQTFQPYDARLLQEAIWHRDISRWAQGSNFNDLARATALFDWTVRNIQLDADEDRAARRPWQVLLHGRGTAEQRAWVFAMLARQQGLDVVVLTTRSSEGDASDAEGEPRFWLPAALIDGQLYLFDTRLGLPIPGPDGEGVATLEQLRSDDALLRQLDLEDAPYGINADALRNVVPHIVADPFDLTRRARQVESKLSGDDHVVLTSRASDLAERLKSVSGLAAPQLWEVPFESMRDQLTLGRTARQREALAFEPFALRPVLWKARARHFQGRRPVVDPSRQDRQDVIDDHGEAAQLYTSKAVRPTDREIAQTAAAERRRMEVAKLNATYWVGLLSFDDGKYPIAAQWLARPELSAADSPWSAGARYNLARTHEAQGNLEAAIKLLEQDDSPQQHGNRLRARQLKQQLAAMPTSD